MKSPTTNPPPTRSHWRRWIILLSGVWCLLSVVAILADGLTDERCFTDVALVLGNRVEPGGQPSPRLQARLDKAVQLYHQGHFPRIIVSGGVGQEGYDEAAVMQATLIARGIPAARIFVDSAGDDTYNSARNTARLLTAHELQSVLVISQHFHLARAKLALRRFGVTTVCAVRADYFEWRDIYATAREVVAYYVYLTKSFN